MSREPFFAKYIRAAERAELRDEQDAHVSELTFAQESTTWLRGDTDCV